MHHKLFFDTNIFLNVILDEVDCVNCTKLLDVWNNGLSSYAERAGTSFLSFADIAYVLRKKFGAEQVKRYLDIFYHHLAEILPNDETNMLLAFGSKGPDFEDILQYICAVQNGYDVIVTCNKKHFEKIQIPESVVKCTTPLPVILTPDEVLSLIHDADES